MRQQRNVQKQIERSKEGITTAVGNTNYLQIRKTTQKDASSNWTTALPLEFREQMWEPEMVLF